MKTLAKILCVDDEQNVINGLKRTLFDEFEVVTALGGAEGLAAMDQHTFSVIISDMRMPEMNGAQFLLAAREKSADATRILLTGQSDMESAISAINDGHIFRFLLKPCPEDKLKQNIFDAVRQYNLITSEKELLENTLKGSINVLTEVLSIAAPSAFSRASHIKDYVSHMAKLSNKKNVWEYEIAAMLSQLGSIVLPPDILKKAFGVIPLDEDEEAMLGSIPEVGAKLVASIPRLENVAAMIAAQNKNNAEEESSEEILFGVRMLRIAKTVDKIIIRENISLKKALQTLPEIYSSKEEIKLIEHLASLQTKESGRVLREITVADLKPGMILDEDVLTKSGSIVLSKDQELNIPLINRLQNFAKRADVKEPIRALVHL